MADIDRPDRITNITGLRAQPETPGASSVSIDRRGVRWPATACRLCERPVWVFARSCACGMPAPGRDARAAYLVRGGVAVVVLAALGWWTVVR